MKDEEKETIVSDNKGSGAGKILSVHYDYIEKPCAYIGCGDRRLHHEQTDTPRGKRMIKVPKDHEGPVYCSLTCMFMDPNNNQSVSSNEPFKYFGDEDE